MQQRQRLSAVVALVAAAMLAGCGADAPAPTDSQTPTSSPTSTPTPTPEPLTWGPSQADLDAATATAAAMSTADAAGQVVVARFGGPDPATAADLMSRLHLAGVMVFADNITDAAGVQAIANATQQASVASRRDWPAMVAIDEEGGAVQRLGDTGVGAAYPPFMAAGAADDASVVHDATHALALELRGLGITTDFAPDADITSGPANPAIGMRSPAGDPQLAADAVTAALGGFADGGVLASIKHFPGHGSLTADSHQSLPVQEATDAELAAGDLVPFQAGVDAGAPMVMVGHIAVTAWEPGVPASISTPAYQHLRATGFTGVAVTDALDMGALAAFGDSGQLAVRALAAGADLLLTPADPAAAVAGITAAIDAGQLSRDRLNEAAGRVIAMQRWQASLAEAAGPPPATAVADAGAASAALSAAAVTLVSGACTGALVGPTVHLHGGSVADWNGMVAALEAHGLSVVPLEQAADSEVRLLGAVNGGGASSDGAAADASIALDWPHALAASPAAVRIAAFGHTPGALDAAAAVLAGDATAPGSLPIAVDGLAASAC